MSFFIRLLEATDANRRELEALPKVQAMLHGKMSRESYTAFLMDLYHIAGHFRRVMIIAASGCSDEFTDVRNHLYRNIDEQEGREEMVLNDLQAFNLGSDTVQSGMPSYPVQAMLAYNYHTSERIHPCSVLGMLYVLEIISSVYGGQVATSISNGLGMPLPQGFTFLESHASMDLDHMANLRVLLQTIEDTAVQDAIINAIQMNFYLFTQFLKN